MTFLTEIDTTGVTYDYTLKVHIEKRATRIKHVGKPSLCDDGTLPCSQSTIDRTTHPSRGTSKCADMETPIAEDAAMLAQVGMKVTQLLS